jgi:hypothetical protein
VARNRPLNRRSIGGGGPLILLDAICPAARSGSSRAIIGFNRAGELVGRTDRPDYVRSTGPEASHPHRPSNGVSHRSRPKAMPACER